MKKGCPSCGRMVDGECEKCPFCNYDFNDLSNIINKYEKERIKEIKIPKYAGFIKRVVACGVDLFIWSFIFTIITSLYAFFNNGLESLLNIDSYLVMDRSEIISSTNNIIWLFMPVCYFFYCVFSQYSKKMATIGQRIVGIEVTTTEDEPLSFGQAFMHNLAKIVNVITLGIGFIIVIFTQKKQSLSDIVTKTCVANKITDEDYSTYRYANPLLRFLAYIIDVAYLSLIGWLYSFLATTPFVPEGKFKSIIMLVLGITLLFYIITYFPSMESRYGATFGKRILDIKVVKLDGEKPSFMKSLFRWILMTFENLIPLSHILAFVNPRKQTLKDILTKTIVINRT